MVEYAITLYIVVTINFFLPRMMPGDPFASYIANLASQGYILKGTKQIIEFYKAKFGLSGSLFDQYIAYLRQLSQGDLGISLSSFPKTVQELIAGALPWTIGLLTAALIVSWVVGNLIGVFLGWSKKGKVNSMLTYIMLFINQVPFYILAIILMYLFAFLVPIFPLGGAYKYSIAKGLSLNYIMSVIYHSILPAISLIMVSLGGWMITMRSNVVNILGEDFLLLAKAKGLRKDTIRNKYVFRNALLPQITGLAISLGTILSGSLLVEIIYGYPGIGLLLSWATINLDYNLMMGIFVMSMFVTLTASLLIDLIYPLLDPRIRYGGK